MQGVGVSTHTTRAPSVWLDWTFGLGTGSGRSSGGWALAGLAWVLAGTGTGTGTGTGIISDGMALSKPRPAPAPERQVQRGRKGTFGSGSATSVVVLGTPAARDAIPITCTQRHVPQRTSSP
ncbi:hypothetical protein VDGL01_07171 [Verticillium dahliae]